jgi:predicted ATP-grasp superfamily ATP-dependent carboligase
LNEGARTNFDVIVFLVESLKNVSEIGSAAAVSGNIMKLLPGLSCHINSLLSQAKTIEQDFRKLKSEQKNMT